MHADASLVTRIHIDVPVKPTENIAKVKAAVLNIFPDAMFEESEGALAAEAASLEKLKEAFRKQRIRDTARRILRGSSGETGIRFSLNKQAAFAGKANFAPPSPMGPIEVTITDDNLGSVVDFLTEKPGARPTESTLTERA
jgi:predicted RNA binding protein with dsRBD fold (UPF0201 family)